MQPVKLENYNRIVFAILGTTALAGLLTALGSLGYLAARDAWRNHRSCPLASGVSREAASAAPAMEATAPHALEAGRPIVLHHGAALLIPVLDDRLSGTATDVSDEAGGGVANFLLYDRTTRTAQPVLPKNGYVLSYRWLDDGGATGDAPAPNRLLVAWVDEDTNHSTTLDENDVRHLALWQDRPLGLRPIGPAGASFVDHTIDDDTGLLYLRLRPTGSDDEMEETALLWEVDLAGSGPGREVKLDGIGAARKAK